MKCPLLDAFHQVGSKASDFVAQMLGGNNGLESDNQEYFQHI